jgi:hypothetical protein
VRGVRHREVRNVHARQTPVREQRIGGLRQQIHLYQASGSSCSEALPVAPGLGTPHAEFDGIAPAKLVGVRQVTRRSAAVHAIGKQLRQRMLRARPVEPRDGDRRSKP